MRYRAQFEGMILPQGDTSIQAKEPTGPFLVEVYETYEVSEYKPPKYAAKILPTGAKFGGRSFKDVKEAMDTTAAKFRKMTQAWYEV